MIDDEVENHVFYSTILGEDGFTVTAVFDGDEAFAKLEKEEFDLILIDIVLKNESGIDLLKKIKKNSEWVYSIVVMISGALISPDHQANGLDSGADGYITRPIQKKEFLSRINAFMRHRKLVLELKKSEERLYKIVDRNPDAILVIDKNGAIKFANKAAENMFQISVDILLERLFGFPLVAGENAEINIVRRSNDEVVGEMRTIDIEWGGIDTFLTSVRDISDKKKLWDALVKAKEKAEESERLKSAFLANMSHEIRTPMNGILGFADLLQSKDLSDNQYAKYVNIIKKSGVRMLNTINDLIDISKLESGQMELRIKESDIIQQLDYIITFFTPETEKKKIDLRLKNNLNKSNFVIYTDKEKVYSILTNLVKNAIKYTDNGYIEIGISLNENKLSFYVKDTGSGIPKKRQKAIFDRFIQADIEDVRAMQGSGLGLTISKAYVEMLGGKLWLESEVGKGSKFYFTIAANQKMTVDEDKKDIKFIPKKSINKKKVLIAEDDETSQMLLSILINNYSSELIKVRTGIEAIEAIKKNPDIDMILMDIKMPIMGGYEAVREIRKFNRDVIIIAQTAYGLKGDREIALKMGCNEYISKPIVYTELYTLLNKFQ